MAPLLANPTGGVVVAGAVTIGSAGATLSINQSTGRAIINWQQFSIAGGETTKFIVPNSGATLNRVVGGNLSAIYGTLQSNGALYLINPSGILVGPSGRINTSSFMASTLDVSNEQFLAGGDLTLSGSNGTIDNEGIIHASGGDVYLIANQVTNNGTIKAPHGTVGLAAGSEVLYKQAGSQHLFIQSTPTGTKRALGVTNAGTIQAAAAELKAAGGNAYALAINNTGVIAATGYKKINGQVYLTSDGGSITNSGKISAKQANGNGGTIVVDGTATTSTTSGTVTNSGTLDASATAAGGSGGTVTVKNMGGTTVHSGMILAKGGQGGTGGNAEVSGGTLVFTGLVDLTAPGGTTGTLLLDPAALDVVTGGTGQVVSGENDANSTTISPTTVENALSTANLVLNADTTLTISNAITWTSATTLTLSTNDSGSSSIVINAPISGVNGGLTIAAAGSDPITTGAAGSVDVASFILQSGTWNQVSATLPAFMASQDFELQGGSTFERFTGGDGSSGTPYQINDVYGLQGLASPSNSLLSAYSELVSNIDATGTSTWNSGAGFISIGNDTTEFTGTFNGMNHYVNGIYVNVPGGSEVGPFGETSAASTIENVGLTNVQIIGANYVGGLVGWNKGTVLNSYSTGTVTGLGVDDSGGLVGLSWGAITSSYSTASVNGISYAGGLVGVTYGGSVTSSYSTGSVTVGSAETNVGGLVGYDDGGTTINDAYSTGAVTAGSGSSDVGGLVGLNAGDAINNTYSTGLVTGGSGSSDVGGLVGYNDGTVNNSFWDVDSAGSGIVSGVGSDSTPNATAGVTPATTAELESQSFILANSPVAPTWDFTNVWTTDGGTTTPQLIGLPTTAVPTGSGSGNSGGGGSSQASSGSGGIDGSGSTIVPPAIIPQTTPIVVPTTIVSGTGNQQPFSFEGNGTSGGGGQQGGGLADSSGNSGQVGGGDVAQLNNGELNNVANPHATGALTAALGPVVYHNLSDALQNAGDFTDADATDSGDSDGTASNGSDDGETILNGGDVAEVGTGSAKKIALNQAPPQLRNALAGDVLQNVSLGN
jgi:filamentous hemagglutinin family protein